MLIKNIGKGFLLLKISSKTGVKFIVKLQVVAFAISFHQNFVRVTFMKCNIK